MDPMTALLRVSLGLLILGPALILLSFTLARTNIH